MDQLDDEGLSHIFLLNRIFIRVGCTYKEVCEGFHNFVQILYFASAQPGKGHGPKLMNKFKDHVKCMRFTRIYLYANERALSWYKTHEFVIADLNKLPKGVLKRLHHSQDATLMMYLVDGWE